MGLLRHLFGAHLANCRTVNWQSGTRRSEAEPDPRSNQRGKHELFHDRSPDKGWLRTQHRMSFPVPFIDPAQDRLAAIRHVDSSNPRG
jgi:hypothetical protein